MWDKLDPGHLNGRWFGLSENQVLGEAPATNLLLSAPVLRSIIPRQNPQGIWTTVRRPLNGLGYSHFAVRKESTE